MDYREVEVETTEHVKFPICEDCGREVPDDEGVLFWGVHRESLDDSYQSPTEYFAENEAILFCDECCEKGDPPVSNIAIKSKSAKQLEANTGAVVKFALAFLVVLTVFVLLL